MSADSDEIITITASENLTNTMRTDTIIVTGLNNETQTISVTQEGRTGISSVVTEKIRLYPNPVGNSFRVEGLKGRSTLFITDLDGKLLLSKQINRNEFIQVNSLQPGIYLVRIVTVSGTMVKKLVKE
jgi:hypothetical protein